MTRWRLPCGLLPCPCVIIAFGGGVACLVACVSVRLYSSGACGVALALWLAFPSAYIVAVYVCDDIEKTPPEDYPLREFSLYKNINFFCPNAV